MPRLKQVKGWDEYSKELKKAGTRWKLDSDSKSPFIQVRVQKARKI